MKQRRSDVFIDARLLAYRRGGISRYVRELCRCLPRVAPDLSIRCFANRPTDALPDERARVFTPPHFRLERITLGVELAVHAPKVVHSPDFVAPMSAGAKRVITVHDLSFITHPEHLSAEALRYYRQVTQSVEVADRIIAVSRYTAEQLIERMRVDPGKLVTIWNGVDQCRTLPSPEAARETTRIGLDPASTEAIFSGRPIILSVGTIEPRKRLMLLLQALRHLTAVNPLLLIVGQQGWSCDEIVAEIRNAQMTGDALWLNAVDDTVLDALYRLATLLAIPSLDEGFGLPAVEAMRAGLPVVAARRGALPEVLGDAAMLVAEDDPVAWASALASLLASPVRRQLMSENGATRAKEFTWERTALRTADVYREVLNR